MKILELCPYSSAPCGVWNRVKQEAVELSKRHEVRIFSSNIKKGKKEILPSEDIIHCQQTRSISVQGEAGQSNKQTSQSSRGTGTTISDEGSHGQGTHKPSLTASADIIIQRFPARKLGGESFMSWNFKKAALDFAPDVIIAHNYRHIHTTQALKLAHKLSCKVFLVSHSPFIEDNATRSRIATMAVKFYDKFIGPRTLPKFTKILAISHWEVPCLIKCGAKEEQIVYVPNGVNDAFFSYPCKVTEENKLLFLGRASPIKGLKTVIRALKLLNDKQTVFEIVGESDENYKQRLLELAYLEGVQNRVIFSPPVYGLEKIKKIDSCRAFVLASKREGMPQALIEAMARGKIVIGSNIPAIKDLISPGENGYLFRQGDAESLAKTINHVFNSEVDNGVKLNARESIRQFAWSNVADKIEEVIK